MTVKSTILPAAPGFFALSTWYDDEADKVALDWKSPVLAWAVRGFADREAGDPPPYAGPVTCEGERHAHAVQLPDGTVTNMDGTHYPSVDTWLRAETESYAAARAARAAKLAAKAAAPAAPVNPFAPRDPNNKKTLSLAQHRGTGDT